MLLFGSSLSHRIHRLYLYRLLLKSISKWLKLRSRREQQQQQQQQIDAGRWAELDFGARIIAGWVSVRYVESSENSFVSLCFFFFFFLADHHQQPLCVHGMERNRWIKGREEEGNPLVRFPQRLANIRKGILLYFQLLCTYCGLLARYASAMRVRCECCCCSQTVSEL